MTWTDYVLVNEYITWPDDFLPIVPYTLFFALIHWVIKDRLITPIAKKYLVEDLLAKERREALEKAALTPTTAVNGDAVETNVTKATPRRGRAKKEVEEPAAEKKEENKVPAPKEEEEDGPKLLEEKFGVASWNFFCHTLLMVYGWHAIGSEPWLADPSTWFVGWPSTQTMSPRIFTLFYLFTGYYIYSFIDLFRQLRQKDFVAMVVHHSVSLFLLVFAFCFGFQRVGCVLMLYHEASDPFMELAKMCVYMGYQKMADVLFGLFALVFIVSRDIQYPINVIWPAWKYAPRAYPDGTPDPGVLLIVMIALLTLLALHIFWSAIIVTMVFKALRDGSVKGDVRDQHFDEVEIEKIEHAAN